MKNIYSLLAVLLILLTGCSLEQNPNVLLIVVDDLGWSDLGCYGSDLYQTPNIDKLAAGGMRFTDAYSTCTVCSPTRASIMTGKYPARLNCTDWISGHNKPFARFSPPDWKNYLDLTEYTLADALNDGGYTTVHLGKWHLGDKEKYWPENRGFDLNIGGWSVGAPQRKIEGCNGYFSPYCNPRLEDGPEGEYLTERLAKEAIEFLENRKESKQPFFMNLWFYNVHTPLQAKQEKIQKYKILADDSMQHSNPVYAAMVEHTDDAVGKVMNKLKEVGFDDNTIIVFTSDNGGLCGNWENLKQKVTSNYPFRSGKGDMFEGGVRVPFIVRWNSKIKTNVENSTPVNSTDIYPTLLSLTSIQGNPEQNSEMDGMDLSDVLLNEKTLERDALYWHYPHYHLEGAVPYSAIRKGNWKLIEIYENDELMLFNLETDIGEKVNLSAQNPEKTKELLNSLNKWKEEVEAQMPVENPGYISDFQQEWKMGIWQSKSNKEFLNFLQNK